MPFGRLGAHCTVAAGAATTQLGQAEHRTKEGVHWGRAFWHSLRFIVTPSQFELGILADAGFKVGEEQEVTNRLWYKRRVGQALGARVAVGLGTEGASL